jgi:hypothetical protein
MGGMSILNLIMLTALCVMLYSVVRDVIVITKEIFFK